MADRFDEMARAWLPGPNHDSDIYANESAESVAARLSALLRKVHDEAHAELLAARKAVEAAREYRDECDQKCACVFTARLLAALDEADKAVVG